MPLAFCRERIMKLGQWLISAGCVILFGTAIYHAADYTSMARAMGASDAKPALIADMKASPLFVCVFGPERTSCQVQHGFRAERPMNENHGRAAPLLDIMQRNAVG